MSGKSNDVPMLFFTLLRNADGRISVPFSAGSLALPDGLQRDLLAGDIEPLLRLCHPDDETRLNEALLQSERTMSECRLTLRLMSASGVECLLELRAVPRQTSDHPKALEWQGVARQVRERPAPVGNEIDFRKLVEALPTPILCKNRQGQNIWCNRAFEDLVSTPFEVLEGTTIDDFFPVEDTLEVKAVEQACLTDGMARTIELETPDTPFDFPAALLGYGPIRDANGIPEILAIAVHDLTEHKNIERQLREALDFAQGVIGAIPDVLFEVDRDGRYLQVWTKNPELLAQQRDALVGRTAREVLPETEAAAAMQAIADADAHGVCYGHLIPITQANGEVRWFEHSLAKMRDNGPDGATFLVLSRDVTERKLAQETIEEARRQFLTVLQTIPDMVWLKDVEGRYVFCNPAFEQLVGKPEAEIIGKSVHDLYCGDIAQTYHESDLAAIGGERILMGEERLVHRGSGETILLETRKVPVLAADGTVTGILGVERDVTELVASREKIRQMAFYDQLTSLPNRTLFNDRLQQMITDAAGGKKKVGVMLIDLDHFKTTNDTMGHHVGDELLCQVAHRLAKCMGEHDAVARLGGDEFGILVSCDAAAELASVAERILDKFATHFMLNGREVFISCSIGIATCPGDSGNASDLVKFADAAMYAAKRKGRSGYCFYSKALTADAERHVLLEAELRRAIERDELELHYQPKVNLEGGAVVGSEALLRWRHPEMGLIPPAQFVKIAEETGIIRKLGQWVLHEACRTAAEMNAGARQTHKIAINLSAREFRSQDLARLVARILAETRCRGEWIEIEITESLLLDRSEETLHILLALQNLGITIAIDDFGTGYSALSYLSRFPIDTLKIDRSFIVDNDSRSKELVKAIISMADCLGQNVVAEGVETEDQAAFLRANGCPMAQGYFFGKPMPKPRIMAL